MHLPSESLNGTVCPITATIALVGISVATYLLIKSDKRPTVLDFALTTLAVLALQALNYPLPGGFSGHALGATLAVVLLGLPAGVLSMACVITIQCLFFADGGRLELGANILNMALLTAVTSGIVLHRSDSLANVFVASSLSVFVAVTAVGTELLLDSSFGNAPLALISALMVYHLPIILIEGLITVSILYALRLWYQQIVGQSKAWAIAAVTLVLFAMIPFASSSPDALETVLQEKSQHL